MSKSVTYAFWQHGKSGEVWAVELSGGRVRRACGPLHYSQVKQENLEHFVFETGGGAWVALHEQEFNLAVVQMKR